MTGKDLLRIRTKNYLSQSDLAKKLGVAPSQISRWERSSPISKRYQRELQAVLYDGSSPTSSEEQTSDLRELIESYKEQIKLLKAENERLQAISLEIDALRGTHEMKTEWLTSTKSDES